MKRNGIIAAMRTMLSKKFKIMVAIVVFILLVIFAVTQIFSTRPSIESYCKLYKSEKIATTQNYSSKDFANAYDNLEKVSPTDIRSDTSTVRKTYEKINSDPSQTFTDSFNGLSAETHIQIWVKKNCVQ